MSRGQKTKSIGFVILLYLIVNTAFIPSLKNDFVNWDDDRYIYKNTEMLRSSWRNPTTVFTVFHEGHYLPLTLLSFSIEYHFFDLNPLPYHRTNLIIHNINCLLLYWLIFILSKSHTVSFITALLFGIHPFHVGVVAWITNRKELLSTAFFLGSTISYLYYTRKYAREFLYLSFLLFILALLSKSMAITLPLILLLCDYLSHRRLDLRMFREKIPFFLTAVLFGIIALLSRASARYTAPEPVMSLDTIFGSSYNLINYYLLKQIIPLHPYIQAINRDTINYWISPLLVLLLFLMAVVARKYSRKITFGLLFFLITILPPLRLMNIGPIAVRYGYIPSIGLYFIFSVLFTHLLKRKFSTHTVIRYVMWAMLIYGLAVLFFQTRASCRIWKNGITLYSDIMAHAKYPYNVGMTLALRADAYTEKKMHDEALRDLNQSLTILPDQGMIYLKRARLLFEEKEYKKAREDVQQAVNLGVEVDPGFIKLINNPSYGPENHGAPLNGMLFKGHILH